MYRHVHTSKFIYLSSYMLRPGIYRYKHVFACMFEYILVQPMYISGTYIECTSSCVCEHKR